MNQYFFDNLRKPEEKRRTVSLNKIPKNNSITSPLQVNKIEMRKTKLPLPPRMPQILSKRNHTANPKVSRQEKSLNKMIPKLSLNQNRVNHEEFLPNGVISSRKCVTKPSTAHNLKRPKEGLQKGQNQLILERLQQKYNLLCKESVKNSTTRNFFIRSEKNLLSKQNTASDSPRKERKSIDLKNKMQGGEEEKLLKNNYLQDIGYKTSYVSPRQNPFIKHINEESEQKQVKKYSFLRLDLDSEKLSPIKIIGNYQTLDISKETIKIEKCEEVKLSVGIEENENTNINISKKRKNEISFEFNEDDIKMIDKKYKKKQDAPVVEESSMNNPKKGNSTRRERLSVNHSKTKFYPTKETLQDTIDKDFESHRSNQNSYRCENTPKLQEGIENNENGKNDNKNDKSTKDNTHNTYKIEESKVADIMKRVLEKNKKEAAVRHREFFSNFPQSYMNLNSMNQTQGRFFIGSAGQNRGESYSRPFTSDKKAALNYLELIFKDTLLWKKHEEIWANISTETGYIISVDLEKYLIPPNDYDILISSYFKINDKFQDKVVIDDNVHNAKEEIQKWKKAYKRAILRWHPDKLFPFIEELKLRDESKKGILKKKASILINNMNKNLQNILEILKKIVIAKENSEKKRAAF